MPLVRVEQLVKSFGSTQAVRGISIDIAEGRCVTLLGPNGAGKTTTLRMLAGLLAPTSGKIEFAGANGTDLRSMIGYLPQYPAFYTWMTGKEYLVFVGQLARMKRSAAEERADELLAEVGLSDAARRRIGGYSGGMKQRLGLAQAMMHRPKLVIMDEPVSALDPIGRREVLDMMRKLKEQTTILFSTHVLPDAQEITDDLFIMNHGKIVVSGGMRELIEQHREPVIRLRSEHSLENRMAELAALAGVESARWKGDYAELVFADLEAGRLALMRYIADEQIPVRKLELAELSLEDLFMKAVQAG